VVDVTKTLFDQFGVEPNQVLELSLGDLSRRVFGHYRNSKEAVSVRGLLTVLLLFSALRVR